MSALEFRKPRRKRAAPARPNDREISTLFVSGSAARRLEDVRPHVEHRHKEVAALIIGHVKNHRLARQIDPRRGIKRVGVRRYDRVVLGRWERRNIRELAEGGRARSRWLCNIRCLRLCDVHQHDRETVLVGIGRRFGCSLLGNAALAGAITRMDARNVPKQRSR